MSSSRVLHSQIISAIIHCSEVFDKAILYMKKPPTSDLSKVDGFLPVSRCDRIRTCDLCVPNAALYQAEPRIDIYEALCCLSNRASLYYHKFFCLSRKILYFFNFFEISNKAA